MAAGQAPDIVISQRATKRPIVEIAATLGMPAAAVIPWGRWQAKLDTALLSPASDAPRGKLVLVTAMSPTPAGEGKTTVSIGLGDALNRLGRKASICLREPSQGPCFGRKGGGTGGGFAQVVPMEDINLHFTGDIHAVGAAHNLLAAMVDNELHWHGGRLLDTRAVHWGRVVDMNDRALRHMVIGLGGAEHGVPRQSRFDIAVASEVMAILCLATDTGDLRSRLARIVVGNGPDGTPVTAGDLGADGAMAALLRDALLPNLVQTLEHTPAFVHGGPFANIAHGCSSLVATRTALQWSEFVVTEAGFGADLGAEKFFDIKCVAGGLQPALAVVVATLRALKYHGGVDADAWQRPNAGAIRSGFANLARHLANLRLFGVEPVVAINRFTGDTDAELELVRALCAELGVEAIACSHWSDGGAGALELARRVVDMSGRSTGDLLPLYPESMGLWEKIETIAARLYGAGRVEAGTKARKKLADYQRRYGDLRICMAKTPASFTGDVSVRGAPSGHELEVRDLRLAAGAGFVVAMCGDILTMPGLPREPNAAHISLDEQGQVTGLA